MKAQLVRLKHEELTQSNWNLGRIIKVHSGSDNFTRIINIKTGKGIVKRAIESICLPLIEGYFRRDETDNHSCNSS